MRSKSAFSIRKATDGDCAGILECLSSAFAPFRESYTVGAFLDTVLNPDAIWTRLQQMNVFVAVEAGARVVGTISCRVMSEHEGHLRGMAVLPDWQGSLVARQLLARVEQELRGAGCSVITLDTTQPLQRAIRFYEKHGFQRTARVDDFFGMPLLEYQKTISAAAEENCASVKGGKGVPLPK